MGGATSQRSNATPPSWSPTCRRGVTREAGWLGISVSPRGPSWPAA